MGFCADVCFQSFWCHRFHPITVPATIASIITCALLAPPPPLLWLPPPWPCHCLYRLWITLTSASFLPAPSPVTTTTLHHCRAALASPSTAATSTIVNSSLLPPCCFPLLPHGDDTGEFVLITLAHCQVISPVIPEVWWEQLRSETSDDKLIILSKCLRFFSFSLSLRTSSRDTQMRREVTLRTNSSNTFMP